jgi:hypothetical protein
MVCFAKVSRPSHITVDRNLRFATAALGGTARALALA